VNESPRPPPASSTPARTHSASRKLESAEKRQALREYDLQRTVEHLKEFEHNFKETSEKQTINGRILHMQVEEHCQALENERGRQRSASGNVLKRYRNSQLSTQEAEKRCNSLRTRYAALTTELHESCQALSSSRERQCRRIQLEHSSQNEEHRSSKDGGKSREPSPGQACKVKNEEGQLAIPLGVLPLRPVPDIEEVRQRLGSGSELYAFYLHVFPLLRGVAVEIFRKSGQRFEVRQLLLSSDLQRLEFWPESSKAMLSAAQGGSGVAGGAFPSRSRRRVAESFLRVEWLTRIHVPRTTLGVVQQSTTADNGTPRLLGQPHSQPSTGKPALPFDLVVSDGEPWRLSAPDVHSFHVITAAVGALMGARASLPAFALMLGLGVSVVSA